MYSKYGLDKYYDNEGPPQDEMQQLLKQKARDLFALCDKEGKGFACKEDIHSLREELPLSCEQLDEVFEALDKDKNGCLTLEEFTEGLGMFLGIECQLFQRGQHLNDDINSCLNKGEQEDDDERFEDFLDQLGANNVFKDEDYIRQMWDRVKKDEPSIMENFENFLAKITQELRNTKKEYTILENTLKSRSDVHEDQVQALYQEMEEQLQSEKETLLATERSKEQKMRNELGMELQLKDKQLQDLLTEHAELEKQLEEINALDSETKHENIKLQKERDGLELRLSASEKMLQDMTTHLNVLRRRSLQEKRKRAKAAIKVSEDIALEREDLVKQLCELKKVNKQLLDEKDELTLSATSTPINISDDDTPSQTVSMDHFFSESPCRKVLNSKHGSSPSGRRKKGSQKVTVDLISSCSFSESTQTSPDPCHQLHRIPTFNDPLVTEDHQSTSGASNGKEISDTEEKTYTPLLEHFTISKSEEDCEVDDHFFDNNPQFLGLPEKDRVLLQNNLNLTLPPKCDSAVLDKVPSEKANNISKDCKTPVKYLNPSNHRSMDTRVKSDTAVKSRNPDTNGKKEPARGKHSSPERLFKVVFIGDSGVGKTSFIHRFCHDSFKPTFNATVGVDFQVKTVNVDGRIVALQLWDTAGQERFRSITQQYYRKADGIVVVYDVTSEISFKSVRNWMTHLKEGADENVVLMLIGNKIDLCENDEDRVVRSKHGSRIADEFGTLFYETSAKNGNSVNEAMEALSSLLQVKEDEVMERVLKLQEVVKPKKKKCC